MAKDKKENESMNDSDEFLVKVGEKVRAIRKSLTGSKGKCPNQAEFHELVYPEPCSEFYRDPGTKACYVGDWENGNHGKDKHGKDRHELTLKDIYAIAKVAGISPSELLNVDMPYKVQERSLADWFKTLFVDMPESFDVDWDVTQIDGDWVTTHDKKRISIALTFPMEIVHDENGYPAGSKDTILFSELWKCAQTIKEIKNCTFLSNEEKREKALREINELEERLNDDIPF